MLRTTNLNKLIFLLTTLLMLVVVACSPRELNVSAVNDTTDNNAAVVDLAENNAAAPDTTTDNTNASTNSEYNNLPALPAIGAAGATESPVTDMSVSEESVVNAGVSVPNYGMGGGSATSSSLYGRGGGGGFGGGYYGLPFLDTDFVLQTELPTEPAAANVWQSQANSTLTIEQARAIAQQFGFSTELYLDYYSVVNPTPVPLPAEDGVVSSDMYIAPTVYYAFDDTRMLSIYGTDVSYTDFTGSKMYGSIEYMPYEQSLPLVEAFLKDKGLLDFEYVARKNYWGEDVQIFRIVDGREVINPDFTVTVNVDGVIAYLYYSRINEVTTPVEYPLVSAAAAWELLQQGVDYNRVFYNLYPQLDENGYALPTDATSYMPTQSEVYPRQYVDGEAIELYPYLMGYLPAEGEGSPRIQGDQFRLLASAEVLQEMATAIGQQTHIIGNIVQVAPNVMAVQVSSWEITASYPEYRYEAGVLNRDESGQAIFTADAGFTWIIPNAPVEIEDGTRVFVNGWLPPGTDATAPQAFNWQTIEKMQSGIPGIEEITITKVDMVYTLNYGSPVIAEDGSQITMNILQPAWRFSGSTSLGETIEIFVQAVDPAFITQ